MVDFFAITNRGLEFICSNEIATLPGVTHPTISYRRVSASTNTLSPLLSLRTVDDVFIHLATWEDIDNKRSALSRIAELCAHIDLQNVIDEIKHIRPIKMPPYFSVTANFVGKRNYTTDEIKLATADGIRRQFKQWIYSLEDQKCDLNIRIFIEHNQAYAGLRIASSPLNKRHYKISHILGSLNPPVAAALVQLSNSKPNSLILDPFCGAGTILIEAFTMGYSMIGGDYNPQAISAALRNIIASKTPLSLNYWDAKNLPLGIHTVDTIITNLPWGKQVAIEQSLTLFHGKICSELERVIKPNGVMVLLTAFPELVQFRNFYVRHKFEISLFGQSLTVLLLSGNL